MKKEYTIDLKQIAFENTDKLVMMPQCQADMESHDHHFFELVYVTGGSATHTLNDKTSTLTSGDYFIVDYGSIHCYKDSRDLTLINCLFLPEVIDNTLSDCHSFESLLQGCLIRYYPTSFGQTTVNHIFHDDEGHILNLIMGMQKEYQEKSAGYSEIFRCRLIEIMILTLRSVVNKNDLHPKSSAVLQLIQYIESNYQDEVTLGHFCHEYHYNMQYISRKFKQETGFTMRDYLQKVRIKKSCELLVGSDMRIFDIALAVGYNDFKFFNSVFKKILKMSPREYRKLSDTNHG